jgi:hypothetical protein
MTITPGLGPNCVLGPDSHHRPGSPASIHNQGAGFLIDANLPTGLSAPRWLSARSFSDAKLVAP